MRKKNNESKYYNVAQYILAMIPCEDGTCELNLLYEIPKGMCLSENGKFVEFYHFYFSKKELLATFKPEKPFHKVKLFDVDAFVETKNGFEFIDLNKIDFDNLQDYAKNLEEYLKQN